MVNKKGCLVALSDVGEQKSNRSSTEICGAFNERDQGNMASAAENNDMCEEDEESTANNGETTLKEGSFLISGKDISLCIQVLH